MTTLVDAAKVAAFQERMVDILNWSFLGLAISVGHHVGLFDVMTGGSWATSAEIARTADLNERYVREWLGAMVVGRIVEYDGAGKYRLPPEHSVAISREARLANMASRMCFIGYLGQVEEDVVTAFRQGGGGFPIHDTLGLSIRSLATPPQASMRTCST
jgi:hypothetical protein